MVADERPERVRSSGGVRTTVWVVISGGEFFGRTLKAGSIRAELDDLALADLGLQVVTCQRMKPELVEGILESLCDTWRETLVRRQQRDMERALGDSLVAAPALDGNGGAQRERRACPSCTARRNDLGALARLEIARGYDLWPDRAPRNGS